MFFTPIHSGHQPSPGPYNTKLSGLLDDADDVAAGVAFLRTLSTVDSSRIVVSGASVGGIMTLFAPTSGVDVIGAGHGRRTS